MDIYEEIKKLTEISAMSGREDRMISYIISRLKESADDLHVDKMGNVTATYLGRGENPPSIAYFTHIDRKSVV